MEWVVSIIILLVAAAIITYTIRNFNGFSIENFITLTTNTVVNSHDPSVIGGIIRNTSSENTVVNSHDPSVIGGIIRNTSSGNDLPICGVPSGTNGLVVAPIYKGSDPTPINCIKASLSGNDDVKSGAVKGYPYNIFTNNFVEKENDIKDRLVLPNPIKNDGGFYPINIHQHGKNIEKFENMINTLKARGGNPSLIPTPSQLDIISSSGPDLTQTEGGYVPNQEIIYPHEFPRGNVPALSASVATDIGTVAEAIHSESVKVPSIREMFRDDGGKRNEDVYSMNNPHEMIYLRQ